MPSRTKILNNRVTRRLQAECEAALWVILVTFRAFGVALCWSANIGLP